MENILETRIEKLIKTILISLSFYKYKDFNINDKQIKKDIELVIYLKKYLGINEKEDNFKDIFKNIKDNLEII
jgi:hypothetical protein